MTAPPKITARIGMMLIPDLQILPNSIAASIGKTINRFAILEVRQQFILARLLGISIKQARVVLRISRPGMFISAVKLLLKYLGISLPTKMGPLYNALEKADAARNALAHSVFVKLPGTNSIKIQLTSSTWDLGDAFEPVSRALAPEGKPVNRKFLMQQRQSVEKALKMIRQLEREVNAALEALNERRRSESSQERRRHRS